MGRAVGQTGITIGVGVLLLDPDGVTGRAQVDLPRVGEEDPDMGMGLDLDQVADMGTVPEVAEHVVVGMVMEAEMVGLEEVVVALMVKLPLWATVVNIIRDDKLVTPNLKGFGSSLSV